MYRRVRYCHRKGKRAAAPHTFTPSAWSRKWPNSVTHCITGEPLMYLMKRGECVQTDSLVPPFLHLGRQSGEEVVEPKFLLFFTAEIITTSTLVDAGRLMVHRNNKAHLELSVRPGWNQTDAPTRRDVSWRVPISELSIAK